MPVITLPDGSRREFPQPVTVAELALAIGPGLAKAALAGKVDGRVVGTSFPIDNDAQVSIITERDPDGLEVIRHSTAHLLAQAVKALFPDAQVTLGPVIEDGFYYDFAYKRGFAEEDLRAIEAKMLELAKLDLPVSRRVLPRDAAAVYFRSLGEEDKAKINEDTRCLSASPGRSREARSSQDRQGARPVSYAGRSAGHGVLA